MCLGVFFFEFMLLSVEVFEYVNLCLSLNLEDFPPLFFFNVFFCLSLFLLSWDYKYT